MTQAPLRRFILEFKPDGIQLRTLNRRADGPNSGTVRRRRELNMFNLYYRPPTSPPL